MNLMNRLRKSVTCRNVLLALALLAGNLLFFLTIWMASKYDKVTLDQFIYQMKSSAAGANRSIFNSAVVRVGVFGVVSTVLELRCTGSAPVMCCRSSAEAESTAGSAPPGSAASSSAVRWRW